MKYKILAIIILSLALIFYFVSRDKEATNIEVDNQTASIATPEVLGITTDGLVAYWNFDEGSGEVAGDSSGNGINGVVSGASWDNSGKIGSALTFSSTAHKVSIPTSNSLSLGEGLTFSAWVNTSSTLVNRYIFDWFNGTSPNFTGFNIGMNFANAGAGKINFQGSKNTAWVGSNTAINSGTWRHIAVTVNSTGYKIYIDGVLDKQVDSSAFLPYGGSGPGAIGNSTANGGYFPGSIDEVRIYNRVLSASEISEAAGVVASDPGGGGTPSSPDTTAPSVSAILASSVTTSGATIAWTTNEASDSQVEYGLTTAYGSSSSLDSSMITSHSVSIASLSAGIEYHFRVKSRDAAGNLTTSADGTFTTSQAESTTPGGEVAIPSSEDLPSSYSGQSLVVLEDFRCATAIAASNATKVVFTCPEDHNFQNLSTWYVSITGATGNWTPINGWKIATKVDSRKFSINVNSATFGSFNGQKINIRRAVSSGHIMVYQSDEQGLSDQGVTNDHTFKVTQYGCLPSEDEATCSRGYWSPDNQKGYMSWGKISSFEVSNRVATITLTEPYVDVAGFEPIAVGQLIWVRGYPNVSTFHKGSHRGYRVKSLSEDRRVITIDIDIPDGSYTGTCSGGNCVKNQVEPLLAITWRTELYIYIHNGQPAVQTMQLPAQIKTGTFNSKSNRFTFWVKWGKSIPAPSTGGYNMHLGTYAMTTTAVRSHYYHYMSVGTQAGSWQKYEFNCAPSHQVGASGGIYWPDQALRGHIYYPKWPGGPRDCMEGQNIMYLDWITYVSPFYGQDVEFADFKFDYIPPGEPEELVRGRAGAFSETRYINGLLTNSPGYEVFWQTAPVNGLDFDVRYSTANSMKTIGFSNGQQGAAPSIPGLSLYRPGVSWLSPSMSEPSNMWVAIRPKVPVAATSQTGESPIWVITRPDIGFVAGDKVTVSGISGNTAANQTNAVILATRPRQMWFINNPEGITPTLIDITASSGQCTATFTVDHNLVKGWKVEVAGSNNVNLGAIPATDPKVYTVTDVPTSKSITFACSTVPDGTYNTSYPGLNMAMQSWPAFSLTGTGNGDYSGGGMVVSTNEYKNFAEIYLYPYSPGSTGIPNIPITNPNVSTTTTTTTTASTTATTTTTVATSTTEVSAKFKIGDLIKTTSNLNVRSTASTSGFLLGIQPLGSIGIISNGPTSSGGFNWWNINYSSGADGWSVEDFLQIYSTISSSAGSNTSGSESSVSFGGNTSNTTLSSQINQPIKNLNIIGTTSTTKPSGTSAITANISYGSKHPEVVRVQSFLISQSLLSSGNATGFFGSQTEEAIKAFQRKYNIVSSGSPSTTGYGSIGPKTRAKINELLGISSQTKINTTTTTTKTPVSSGLTGTKLSRNTYRGISGNDIVTLQNVLIKQGFLAPGNNTGYFGPLTEAAVKEFQKKYNIVNSGTASSTGFGATGPKTRAKINELSSQ